MRIAGLFLLAVFSLLITAYASDHQIGGHNTKMTVASNGASSNMPQNLQNNQSSPSPTKEPPLKPYPRLLPLQLVAPPSAQAGVPIVGISVSLHNPGDAAPNSRLRLIIHEKDIGTSGPSNLSADNVKVEVLENGSWIPVLLSAVEGNVMGAIGAEGVKEHHEQYKRGGFEVPAGLKKTWQLRVTFNLPGTYSLVAAVSPDNGSRHLAHPAHSVIEVQ